MVDTKRPSEAPKLAPLGSRYAEIQIPSIGLDMMVVQGTDYPDLKLGPGHYVDTANPWDTTGRVGIAGHRTTYLHPFFKLDQVHQGDAITIRTEYGTFDYRVNKDPFVVPEAGSGFVLDQTQQPTLVLTTCNPKYSSYQRLIVTAVRIGPIQELREPAAVGSPGGGRRDPPSRRDRTAPGTARRARSAAGSSACPP